MWMKGCCVVGKEGIKSVLHLSIGEEDQALKRWLEKSLNLLYSIDGCLGQSYCKKAFPLHILDTPSNCQTSVHDSLRSYMYLISSISHPILVPAR